MKADDRLPQETIYELSISLRYSKPEIWRLVQVPADATLADLHRIIQIIMPWYDEHLHEFEVSGGGSPYSRQRGVWNPMQADLGLKSRVRFTYQYDFGDSWVHDIKRKKLFRRKEGVQYPVCIDGARAAPPEDSGGVWGYAYKLEVLADPEHEDYEWVVEWMGSWDAEHFNIEAINERLRNAFAKRSSRRP